MLKEIEIDKLITIFDSVAILEGGLGLDDEQEEVMKFCLDNDITHWVLDEIYEKPRRLGSIVFLEPTIFIIKTTGVASELEFAVDFFKSLDYLPDKVGFMMGEGSPIMSKLIKYVKDIKPDIKIYKI